MVISDALWKVFEATGHIGAYLLYKDFCGTEEEGAALEGREN
jgi:hypothetical protein